MTSIAGQRHARWVRCPTVSTAGTVEQFLYREARYADECDYDAWEALWTDDALYWVPSTAPTATPSDRCR